MKQNKFHTKKLIILYVCIFGILVSVKHFLTCFSSYDPRESLAIEIGFSIFWLFLHAPLPIALIDAFGVSERMKSDSVWLRKVMYCVCMLFSVMMLVYAITFWMYSSTYFSYFFISALGIAGAYLIIRLMFLIAGFVKKVPTNHL